MRRIVFCLVALAVIGVGAALTSGAFVRADAEQNAPVAVADSATAAFSVENMTCATCPISVRKAMSRVKGVKTVDVDFQAKTAIVVYDPSLTNSEEIAAASTGVGYPATPLGG